MTGTGTFYLAGGYGWLERHASLAEGISTLSGWRCTARWLEGLEGETDPEVARNDRADVEAADALVVVNSPSQRNSTWVELGIAIGLRKPVIMLVSAPEDIRDIPVFWALPECLVVAAPGHAHGTFLYGAGSGDRTDWPGPCGLLKAAAVAYSIIMDRDLPPPDWSRYKAAA